MSRSPPRGHDHRLAEGLQGSNAVFLGLLLGSMMAFDMGGPVNKAAYAFATGLITSQVYAPMAAVMAAGMVPPLGLVRLRCCSRTASRWMSARRLARPLCSVSPSSPKVRFPMPPRIHYG